MGILSYKIKQHITTNIAEILTRVGLGNLTGS